MIQIGLARIDAPLVVLLLVVAGVSVGAVYEHRSGLSPLDRVQAKFEASDGKGYNWPAFHGANPDVILKCRDVSTRLRVCDLVMPAVDPMTGQDNGWAHEPFACDTVTCGWLKE